MFLFFFHAVFYCRCCFDFWRWLLSWIVCVWMFLMWLSALVWFMTLVYCCVLVFMWSSTMWLIVVKWLVVLILLKLMIRAAQYCTHGCWCWLLVSVDVNAYLFDGVWQNYLPVSMNLRLNWKIYGCVGGGRGGGVDKGSLLWPFFFLEKEEKKTCFVENNWVYKSLFFSFFKCGEEA